MNIAAGLGNQTVASTIAAGFLTEPPAWTRLEPQSVSGDPTPGLEARLHDPLWLLARQWQLGEFQAEDAGSPVAVSVSTSSSPVSAWLPGDAAAAQPARALPPGAVLEPLVEREPTSARGPGLRQRAEAGAQLLAQLADAGVDVTLGGTVLAELLVACPLKIPWVDPYDAAAQALLALLAGRVPDGDTAAFQAAASLAASPPQLPSWLASVAEPALVLPVLSDWLSWYRGQVAPEPDPSADCWIDERLEYRFGLIAGTHTLRAPAFGGGHIEWCDFVADPTATATPDTSVQGSQTLLATPLRFAGQPADRYWQFEDGQVNLGALQVAPHDLARLLLVEFATIYGNDWLVVPVDVPLGSYSEIGSVSYSTTFGEQITVGPADDSSRTGRFRLFEVSIDGSDGTLPGLLVPPAASGTLDGPDAEEVLFLRDEMAMMAWAVERLVTGPSGDPRSRHDEGYPPPFTPGTDPGAELDYYLENPVPAWWVPFLPTATGYATLALRKGAMLVGNQPVQPVGVLLRPNQALVIRDEEVPRDGRRVRRIPTLARLTDGNPARWISRRVTVGRGEGASGLAFDGTVARKLTG
jgi:hypothetical protein